MNFINFLKMKFHKYYHIWPLAYAFIYAPWFYYLEHRDQLNMVKVYYINCPLDNYIPFLPIFAIPYFIWFLYMPAIFIFLFYHSKNEFYRLCAFAFSGMTIALIIYSVFPNGIHLRQELTGDGFLIQLIAILRKSDTDTNVCPSIHVYGTLAAQICLSSSQHIKGWVNRRHYNVISWIIAVLICLSTMFLKQHSIVDVISAVILVLIMYVVIFKICFKNVEFPKPKIDDPREHQVLFFLNKH